MIRITTAEEYRRHFGYDPHPALFAPSAVTVLLGDEQERLLQEECDRYAESASRVGAVVSGAEVRALVERLRNPSRVELATERLREAFASLECEHAAPVHLAMVERPRSQHKPARPRRSLKERLERKRRSKQRRMR